MAEKNGVGGLNGCHEDEALDPRIGQKLEELNKWTENINLLEKNFEECNSKYRIILSESTDKLKALQTKLGKSVMEARPYYDAKHKLKHVQAKCQKAAINFEKACEAYLEAKERISVAEKKFTTATHEFDTTWQEMLNQANLKLTEAEAMKKESEKLHQNSMKDFHSAEVIVHNLQRKLKPAIIKSKIYFDENIRFQKKLSMVKEEIESIIDAISRSKSQYASTLKDLEAISEEIHEKRNCSPLKVSKMEAVKVLTELNLPNLEDSCFSDSPDDSLLLDSLKSNPEEYRDDWGASPSFRDDTTSENSSCQIDFPHDETGLSMTNENSDCDTPSYNNLDKRLDSLSLNPSELAKSYVTTLERNTSQR
ncbi:SH3 domain-binding protein 5-like [Brevipalpus obovatus]|uniref:SH3 domain-binding protein 5-like n=1 Tax=Brevipalpus obovatus TaxID=246614 RepID=UPI003D9F8FA2